MLLERDKCCPWRGKDWKCTVDANSVATVKNSMAVPPKDEKYSKNHQRIQHFHLWIYTLKEGKLGLKETSIQPHSQQDVLGNITAAKGGKQIK